MTFVVPFDGSELAEAALIRASEFSAVLEERVVAVVAIPSGNTEYARERGWIGPDEPFDTQAVVASLHNRVTELVPSADFRHETVGKLATPGTISGRLRKIAKAEDASIVFVGSENAGKLVTGLGSVGGAVAAEEAYDVLIVRDRTPSKISKLKEHSKEIHERSNFY